MEERLNLPPLLGSDDQTLKQNRYDSFYKKRPSDIWTGSVERIEVTEHGKCDHFFEYDDRGVRCKKCFMGLSGQRIEIKEGKLFFNNKRLL